MQGCLILSSNDNLFPLKVVGGLSTLQAIEDIETDNKDRPIEEVRLIKATVFVNPFQEVDDEVGLSLRLITFKINKGITFFYE